MFKIFILKDDTVICNECQFCSALLQQLLNLNYEINRVTSLLGENLSREHQKLRGFTSEKKGVFFALIGVFFLFFLFFFFAAETQGSLNNGL